MVRYGLIGRSLGHSFSRGYFTEKFERDDLRDHRYENFELDAIDELPQLLRDFPDLAGFNVTIPYKRAVVDYLDQLDPTAARVGAVNTVVRRTDGTLFGYNTDVIGFAETLEPFASMAALQGGDRSGPALILGTGGASDAVVEVLRQWDLAYRLVSRRPAGARIGYDDLPALDWETPRLIVNATPVGTAPQVDARPDVPVERLGPQHLVTDLIYNPRQTALLRAAAASGAQTANGLRMLHGQAEAAWALWRRARAVGTGGHAPNLQR